MPANAHLRHFTDEQERIIAQAYLGGWDGTQLATYYGVKVGLIYRVLKRQEVERRGRGSVNVPKGTPYMQSNGYMAVWIPADHPMASMRQIYGQVLIHRLVMAEALGRPLTSNETVHHIDGNKYNNDLENLQLRIGKHGKGQAYRCCDCGSTRLEPTEL